MKEQEAPQGVLEVGVNAVGRIVGGRLYADFGNGLSISVMTPEAVSRLEESQGVSLDGQRLLIRLAFLDVPA